MGLTMTALELWFKFAVLTRTTDYAEKVLMELLDDLSNKNYRGNFKLSLKIVGLCS
jgi:hypothetical protein